MNYRYTAVYRTLAILATASANSATALYAQSALALYDKFLPLKPSFEQECSGATGTVLPAVSAFFTSLKALRNDEMRQRSLRGNISAGLNADDSGPRSLYKVNTGASLKQGTYPSELRFDVLIKAQLKEGEFQEEVSSVKLNYDHSRQPSRNPSLGLSDGHHCCFPVASYRSHSPAESLSGERDDFGSAARSILGTIKPRARDPLRMKRILLFVWVSFGEREWVILASAQARGGGRRSAKSVSLKGVNFSSFPSI